MSNSPHPLLFAPVAGELGRQGWEVSITARDNAQTAQLTRERWPDAEVIGDPSPAARALKGAAIGGRAIALRRWARGRGIDLALSHNSYAQLAAARSLGIHTATAMDYEHQPANHVAFRLAQRVVAPKYLPAAALRSQGAHARKLRRYDGFKEEIYLATAIDAAVGAPPALPPDPARPLVVARTPPAGATYHAFGNPAFDRLLDRLHASHRGTCVVLPRNAEQRKVLAPRATSRFIVPEQAVATLPLLRQADLFIGGGGTMTREAALMGVPTISLYGGRRPAVDLELERRGLMRIAADDEAVGEVTERAEPPHDLDRVRARGDQVMQEFIKRAVEPAGG